MQLVNHFDIADGDPRQWFLLWCQEKNIVITDRTYIEVETLVDYFYYSGGVDQVSLEVLDGAEVVSGRSRQYVNAYAADFDQPNWNIAILIAHAESVADTFSLGLRLHFNQRARDQANLQLLLNRSLALAVGQPYVDDATKEGLPPAPCSAAKPPPKKGAMGVGDAGAGAAQ
jgi:hypothetical protein